MKHIVRTIAFAVLSLGLAAVASARDHPCSAASIAGNWGYSLQGTLILPPGAVPIAFVGTYAVDLDGKFSGTQTSNVNGAVSHDVLRGTLTVNTDCTGTETVGVYDHSGNLLRSAVWAVVFVNDATESRGTFESLTLPNGVNVPAIAIAEGKKSVGNQGLGQ